MHLKSKLHNRKKLNAHGTFNKYGDKYWISHPKRRGKAEEKKRGNRVPVINLLSLGSRSPFLCFGIAEWAPKRFSGTRRCGVGLSQRAAGCRQWEALPCGLVLLSAAPAAPCSHASWQRPTVGCLAPPASCFCRSCSCIRSLPSAQCQSWSRGQFMPLTDAGPYMGGVCVMPLASFWTTRSCSFWCSQKLPF